MNIIFNLFKVKYTKLDELMNANCSNITPNSKINIFINLEMVLNKLASSNTDDYLKIKKEEKINEMVADIINLAAHYRKYFSKNKLYAKVYLYLGYPFGSKYLNREINKNYRKSYTDKYNSDADYFALSSCVTSAIEITQIVLEYIEGVYLITSGVIEPSVVPQIINSKPEGEYNFLVTTDRTEYQYVNDDFYIIRPKQLDSYMVTKNNVINIIKQEDKITKNTDVGANFLSFILSLLGDKYRDIGKVKGLGLSGLIKVLDKAIKEGIISKDISNINILERTLKEEYKPTLRENYMLMDVHAQFMRLDIRHKHNIQSQIVDKFDNADLTTINNNYFTQYPIQLMEITEANTLAKPKSKKSIFDK